MFGSGLDSKPKDAAEEAELLAAVVEYRPQGHGHGHQLRLQFEFLAGSQRALQIDMQQLLRISEVEPGGVCGGQLRILSVIQSNNNKNMFSQIYIYVCIYI